MFVPDGSVTPVGAIIGGVLGGVAAIAVIAIVVYTFKTKTGAEAIVPATQTHQMHGRTGYRNREASLLTTRGVTLTEVE